VSAKDEGQMPPSIEELFQWSMATMLLATTYGVEELYCYLPGVALTKSVRATPDYFI
jgi:hypothetical protein